MNSTVRLGRIAGIDVGANWTWLLVVILLVWSLGAGVFPETNPGLSDGAYAAMAFVAAALFFASLLLHELGHALQARREGMQIDGITLWVFGGVARFRGEFASPGAEFRVAVAGPVVSLLIGVACVGIAVGVPLPSGVDGVVHWLGYINLSLLAFNLIPAFPLDGGRMVRALLWAVTGDLARATRWAAGAGRGFAVLLIVGGFLLATLADTFGGLWLAFIGFFLLSAAEAELGIVEARAALGDLRVADVMVADPVTVDPDLPLSRFIEDVFFAHRHTAYPVAADGAAIGIVSFRQVLNVPRDRWDRFRVRDRMYALDRVLVVDADAAVGDVLSQLMQDDLRRGLVRVDGRPRGLLSVTDVTRVLEVLSTARRVTLPGVATSRPRRSTAPEPGAGSP